MKGRLLLLAFFVLAVLAVTPPVSAQAPAATQVLSQQPTLTAAQALPLTCAQAWIASGKNYTQMRALVVTLAKVSLVNRDLKFPDRRDAGVNAGKAIAADCKADPHGLLFAIVDKHVRRVVNAPSR